LVLGVKVSNSMFAVVHSNNNSEEDGNNRHD
jgi:hypothetical protein